MPQRSVDFPRRIVCLTDETTEVLFLLGEQDRIVGVSGYATRPPEARRKPRVSAFKNAKFDAILALKPDLVLTFSDVQAEITRQLVLRGVTVLNFNQRSIAQILDMIAVLARLVGKQREGQALVESLQRGLRAIDASAQSFPHRPRVFFEEWKDPLISGIRWVEELVEIAGGDVTGGGGLPDADAPPPQAAVQNKLEAITKDKDTQRGSIQKAGASRSSFFLLLVTVWHFIVLHLRFNVHLAI